MRPDEEVLEVPVCCQPEVASRQTLWSPHAPDSLSIMLVLYSMLQICRDRHF